MSVGLLVESSRVAETFNFEIKANFEEKLSVEKEKKKLFPLRRKLFFSKKKPTSFVIKIDKIKPSFVLWNEQTLISSLKLFLKFIFDFFVQDFQMSIRDRFFNIFF